ncbi:MAG: sensor histidine kinase, partial [Bdellovibrionota bacterium]
MLKFLERWLIRPSDTIKDPLVILRVRILSAVLAAFLFCVLVIGSWALYAEHSGRMPRNPQIEGVIYFSVVSYFMAYLLSRTRFHRVSGILFLSSMTLGIATSVTQVRNAEEVASALMWFILVPVLSTLVYSTWATISVSLVAMATMIYAWAVRSDFPLNLMLSEVMALTAVTAFITINFSLRNNEDRKIAHQRQRMVQTSKMSTLGEMAGGVAHEINNPLSIIKIRAEQLREKVRTGNAPPEKIAEGLEKIEQTVMRISRIVKSLLSFARETDDEKPVQRDLKTIFQDTIELCNERFRSHGVDLQVDWPDPSLILMCKPVCLSQVLMNLLSNAYDAVVDTDSRWVRLSSRDLGNVVEISVVDSGRGIPEEIRERIFDPFFTTKPVGKGTGLGLSLSKGLVENDGGEILLDKDAPQTRFLVRIPKSPGISSA